MKDHLNEEPEYDSIPEFICILDRSLSMHGQEKTIIQSFNRWLSEQQKKSGEALVTVALCNESCELLYSRMPIHYVKKLDSFSYYVKGHTACMDTVDEVVRLMRRLRRENCAERSQALLLLVTDGLDNASVRVEKREFEARLEKLYAEGWELLFAGKNIALEFREASEMFLEMRKAAAKTNLQKPLI